MQIEQIPSNGVFVLTSTQHRDARRFRQHPWLNVRDNAQAFPKVLEDGAGLKIKARAAL